jgi:hypothetical protein
MQILVFVGVNKDLQNTNFICIKKKIDDILVKNKKEREEPTKPDPKF